MKLLSLIRENIYIIIILAIGSYLRFDRLGELMSFIGDQGLFYLPARDMILYGIIPLVGPETSHPWIHHGALWTYVLAIILWIFRFDPVAPGYFIAVLGTATILLFYITLNSMFDKKTAILGSILYSTSPLIVMNARIPYHTSPIPFLVILLLFATYKWIKGNVWFFPIITFLLGVLYNHEITTFVFFITIGIILMFGFIKKEPWFRNILDKKLMLVSFISFLVPMIPFILYDISYGWRQTFGFLVWVVYRVVKFPLSLIDQRFESTSSGPSTLAEFFSYYQQLVFAPNSTLALIMLFLTGVFVVRFIVSKTKISLSHTLLFLFLSVGLIGLFIHRVPIEADTLLISPFIIILTTLSILWIFRNNFIPVIVCIIIISASNAFFLLSTSFLTEGSGGRITLRERLEAVEKALSISSGKPYNIVGKGDLSDFKSFTMPYEYLFWWKGQAPETRKVSLKIVIWEKGSEIFVYRQK